MDASPEKVSGDRQLCSSENPCDLAPLDFLSLQTSSLSLQVIEEVWFSKPRSVRFIGSGLLEGTRKGLWVSRRWHPDWCDPKIWRLLEQEVLVGG